MEANDTKMREALEAARSFVVNLEIEPFSHLDEVASELLAMIDAALSAPPRNCDRFGGDIDKLREACARERGLNPEEDFPDVFPDWLLAPSTERKGDGDGGK